MKERFSILILAFAALMMGSCIYPFIPEIADDDIGLIVIEGDIRIGAESYIFVRNTQQLGTTGTPVNISADVWVESNKGEITRAGNYRDGAHIIDTRNLDPRNSYRLHVKPHAQSSTVEYVTDWLEVIITPELEEVSFRVDELEEKITFHVSTTNPDANPYYKWNCNEVWEYTSQFYASHVFNPSRNTVEECRGENTHYCWDRDVVSNIMIASTEALTENRLVDHQIYELPFMSDKLDYLYSLEVIQSSISAEAYVYWEVMLRNTDQTGGLFSPQPSELRGNIHCVNDSSIVVLGYVSASKVSSHRIFVSVDDFPMQNKRQNCSAFIEIDLAEHSKMRRYYYGGYDVVFLDNMTNITSWSERRCVDCRVKGGTK
ncbi:MAG TPA: DUF4249 domain-containing protein, partial [Bacteroidales bacterium]|nr:DUF4249 domain-containing protein [Bacteroidales bacterium]